MVTGMQGTTEESEITRTESTVNNSTVDYNSTHSSFHNTTTYHLENVTGKVNVA